MTGSKKLIRTLNMYGHCVSYRGTTEEIETELTFTVTSASKISAPDLVPDSSLTVGVAYDNFDRFVENLYGKNTLQSIVGIVYQSVSEETSGGAATAPENRLSASGDSTSGRKRRKTFESFGVDIEAYHKKPKISSVECRWDVQIDSEFQRVTNWQKSVIHCELFGSTFSQNLLRCRLVGTHSIELTRKRQKRYGIFWLSINHQHRQQLLKEQ